MIYHATHKKNLASIVAGGLDPSYATGKLRAAWLHHEMMCSWAVKHVAARHGWAEADIILIPVVVIPYGLRQGSKDGVYYTQEVIPVECLGRPKRLLLTDAFPASDHVED